MQKVQKATRLTSRNPNSNPNPNLTFWRVMQDMRVLPFFAPSHFTTGLATGHSEVPATQTHGRRKRKRTPYITLPAVNLCPHAIVDKKVIKKIIFKFVFIPVLSGS